MEKDWDKPPNDSWDDFSREELIAVAPAILALAGKISTEEKKGSNATTDSTNRQNPVGQ